jgi:hypothetical protein
MSGSLCFWVAATIDTDMKIQHKITKIGQISVAATIDTEIKNQHTLIAQSCNND